MKRDTPLPEVATYLPKRAAILLKDESAGVQELACTAIRSVVCFWEEAGVVLDPIQFDAVVTGILVQSLGLVKMIDQQNEAIDRANDAIQDYLRRTDGQA